MTLDIDSLRTAHTHTRGWLDRRGAIRLLVMASCIVTRPLAAQTDYYNTDRGRPVQIEDAYTTERHAFELKLAPVRLERAKGGRYNWGVEPEIAYGILPRTHVELGVPVAYADLGEAGHRAGIAGVDLSVMHNLNVESRSLPALGIRADVLAPVGNLGPDRGAVSLTGMATRTYSWMRFHVNGQYTFGAEPDAASGTSTAVERSRWLAGIAADKTFPLSSVLLTGELFVQQPLASSAPIEYTVGTGVRYQWSPTLALDAGLGRRLTGDDKAWYVTFGTAYAFALASLIPGGGR
ncbi:MAG: transporter [Gemmatimonadaceae bacterium]